eukprot:1256669-Amphidinium_carterae.1
MVRRSVLADGRMCVCVCVGVGMQAWLADRRGLRMNTKDQWERAAEAGLRLQSEAMTENRVSWKRPKFRMCFWKYINIEYTVRQQCMWYSIGPTGL